MPFPRESGHNIIGVQSHLLWGSSHYAKGNSTSYFGTVEYTDCISAEG